MKSIQKLGRPWRIRKLASPSLRPSWWLGQSCMMLEPHRLAPDSTCAGERTPGNDGHHRPPGQSKIAQSKCGIYLEESDFNFLRHVLPRWTHRLGVGRLEPLHRVSFEGRAPLSFSSCSRRQGAQLHAAPKKLRCEHRANSCQNPLES